MTTKSLFCDNPFCHGGIGPHLRDECPWIACGVTLSHGAAAEKRRIAKARKELDDALRAHTHIITTRGPKRDCAGAECAICGQDFGWWCPDSLDHVCHYYSDSLTVEEAKAANTTFYVLLIDGTKCLMPKDYKDTYETEDQCIFCGQPQERK